MQYYFVWVSSPQFKSSLPLTYSYDQDLKDGSIVQVPFRNKQVIGLVKSKTIKPDFNTKPITNILLNNYLPGPTLELFSWLAEYYPSAASSHLQLFLPSSLLKIKKLNDEIKSSINLSNLKLPKLTKDQSKVISEITSYNDRTIILHGDTSTGKTRVYIELIYKIIEINKSAIVLTPEIGLTPQLVKVLEQSFPGIVITMHSSLSEKTKRQNWLRIIESKSPIIVVGPRSALFSPVNNLGLIIMDEAHESSYKQEQAPYYQASRVAAKLSELSNAKLIMGTATPLVSDYYVFKSRNLLIARMTQTAAAVTDNIADINVVELTDRNNFKRSNWLSEKLLSSISQSLNNNEQSIVFLNRRGTAQIIMCQNCGWQALCPNCDTSLTYHADSHTMICHSCSFHQHVPSQCPVCSSKDIIFKGIGTKAITEELKKLFPMAKISRFDKDNSKDESLEQNYDDLLSGAVDIIVGTQIITKGLDLPGLSTVGIVMADTSLYFPDYMSEERTFQNLMQVIGRVARGHTSGRVIVQTYHPESFAIKAAVDKNYLEFYNQQIDERSKYLFPPFVYILKISCKRASKSNAQKACNDLIAKIRELNLKVTINGPAPSFHEKQNGRYCWQIIVKSKNRDSLLSIINMLPANFNYDIDPSSLL